jgi:hypothetical protein
MGGNLAWTLRLEDGGEYRMDRWTNVFPRMINNAHFLDGSPAHIRRCLASWLRMKKDWEDNRESGSFKFRMTDVYAPYPYGCGPSEYGLLVTDFQNKVILSSQHYFGIGHVNAFWLGYPRQDQGQHEDERRRFMALAERDRILGARFYLHMESPDRDVPHDYQRIPAIFRELGSEIAWEARPHGRSQFDGWWNIWVPLKGLGRQGIDLMRELGEIVGDCTASDTPSLMIDMSPFSVEEFKDTADDWLAYRKRVADLGFVLSDDEEKLWEDRIKWRREREAEDAEEASKQDEDTED